MPFAISLGRGIMRGTWIAVAAVLGVISFYFQSGGTALAYDNCSTANADICINVGETAKIKVTNRLLQTFCVDSHGNPDDELVTLNVSGEPDTGGAGAIFDPEIIRAYSEFSILSLHTTLGTKPGNYTIDIGGTGTHCGRYHGYRTFLLVRPTVDGPSALWSFNGEKPAGYRTEITFTAQPANMPPYNWYVPATSVLRFSNNSSFITTTTNKAKLHAIRPTRSIDHPTIFISVKGGLSLDHDIKVRTPAELELIPPPRHVDDGRLGYRSVWEYLLLDQYGDPLPGAQLPVEVAWTPGPTKIFRNTNWERSARGPSSQLIRTTFGFGSSR